MKTVVMLCACLTLATWIPASSSPYAAPRTMTDRSKEPVLCVWSLYAGAQAIGRRCFRGKDAAFQRELENSVTKVEEFIVANSSSHPTRSQLAARRASMAPDMNDPAFCQSDVVGFYLAFSDQGAEALRRYTDELLVTPREPTMDPCL